MKPAARRLVQLDTDWGKPDKAAEWQKKLEEFKKAKQRNGAGFIRVHPRADPGVCMNKKGDPSPDRLCGEATV